MSRSPRPRPAAARAAALTAAALTLAVGPAAADRTLTGSASQSFVADTNAQLETGDGFSVGSITSVSLNYSERFPSSQLTLGTGFSFTQFTGRDNDNLDGLFPRLNAGYTVQRSTQSFSVGGNFSITPVRTFGFSLVPTTPGPVDPDPTDPDPVDPDPVDPDFETVRTARETLRLVLGVNAGWSAAIRQGESVNLGVDASRVDFLDNDGSQTPSTRLGASAGWNRTLTQRVGVGLGANLGWFQADDDTERTQITASLAPNVRYARTPAEIFTASLGPALIHTTRKDLATGRNITETNPSLSGAFGFTYALPGRSYSIQLSQAVAPESDGSRLVNRTRLNLSTTQRVTATSSLNAGVFAGLQTAFAGEDAGAFNDRRTFGANVGFSQRVNTRNGYTLSASTIFDDDNNVDRITNGLNAGWNHRLTELVTVNIGYGFRWRTEDNAPDETSHRVQLTLSRPFTLIP